MTCACCGERILGAVFTAQNGGQSFYCCSEKCLDQFCRIGNIILGRAPDPFAQYPQHNTIQ